MTKIFLNQNYDLFLGKPYENFTVHQKEQFVRQFDEIIKEFASQNPEIPITREIKLKLAEEKLDLTLKQIHNWRHLLRLSSSTILNDIFIIIYNILLFYFLE